MNYVLDSSFCGAFIMPDERSQKVTDFFEKITEDSKLCVPALFWYEISNLLTSAIKRRRINLPEIMELFKLLPQSKFTTDFSYGNEYTNTVTSLAIKYGISSYDAAYLELAIRKNAMIGSLDEKLLNICLKADLQII